MPMQPSDTIRGSARGSAAEALAFARNIGARRLDQLEAYLEEVYRLAPAVGIDPAIVTAQSALETDNWRDDWWDERLNPAGIGITGDPVENQQSKFWDSGTDAARGHIVHLWLYVGGKPLHGALTDFAHLDPRLDAVPQQWLGEGRTLDLLGGKWAVVEDYGQRIANRSRDVFPTLPNQREESTMPLDIEVNIATNRIGGKLRDRKAWITVHENGNPNSDARDERNFVFNGGGSGRVSYHFAVDRHRAVQILPLDARGKHAGNVEGNATSIAIETSQQEPDTPNNQTQQNLRALIAAIIARDSRIDYGNGDFEFALDRIRPHRGWPGANPNCPERMLAAWQRTIDPLIQAVGASLIDLLEPVQPHEVPAPHATKLVNDTLLWMVDQQLTAPADVQPKEWADPTSRDAPDDAVIRAGQTVAAHYVVVGADNQLWLITKEGWRVPAGAFVEEG